MDGSRVYDVVMIAPIKILQDIQIHISMYFLRPDDGPRRKMGRESLTLWNKGYSLRTKKTELYGRYYSLLKVLASGYLKRSQRNHLRCLWNIGSCGGFKCDDKSTDRSIVAVQLLSCSYSNKGRWKDFTRHDYLALVKNLTPSPSDMAIICARLVLPRIEIALRSNGTGIFVKADSNGGSVIS